jgi:hypothetical protein
MTRARILLALLAVALCAPLFGQVVVLDTFNKTGASGNVITGGLGPNWGTSITREDDWITIGPNALDTNGWGASGLSIDARTMQNVTVKVRFNTGNLAPFLNVTLYDSQLRALSLSLNITSFAQNVFTTIDIPIAVPAGDSFDLSTVSEWNIGGGSTGTAALRMSFDHLSLTGGQAPTPPTITDQPLGRAIGVGTSTTLKVVANPNNSGALRYQWKRGGVDIPQATTDTLSLSNVALDQGGSFTVAVTNDAGTRLSDPAIITVLDARPTHALAAGVVGYDPLGTTPLSVSNTLVYNGTATALRWSVILPLGWSFHSDDAATANTRPAAGTFGTNNPQRPDDGGMIEWTWNTVPASPFTFTYRLNVPAASAGERRITALATVTQNGATAEILLKPDPLVVGNALERHSADTDGDRRISLNELTRVIELYNTRNNNIRTGAYDIDPSLESEDGFVTAPARSNVPFEIPEGQQHSADWNSGHDGRIDTVELTRVILLYNHREGTVRTGAYRVDPAGMDGFNPATVAP